MAKRLSMSSISTSAALRPSMRTAAISPTAPSSRWDPIPRCAGRGGWLPYVLDEQRACREDVAVFDQTSFAKFMLKGRDALTVLQRLCANDIDVALDRIVYTGMLNARGGFESDLTITRLAPDT